MYNRLPKEQKLELIRRIKSGEKVTKVCQQAGISRTILYRWMRDSGLSRQVGIARMTAKHWKKLPTKIENKIIKAALKNPALSPLKLAKIVGVSQHGVWNILKRNNLNTRQTREIYIHNNGNSLIKPLGLNDKVTMIRRLENGERVSDICRDFKISRTVFYRWLKRYSAKQNYGEQAKREALKNLRPNGERHWRFVPGASNLVLQIVLEHPEYSAQKISNALFVQTSKKILGNHGVHNLLKRLNLNTYNRRLAYAKAASDAAAAQEGVPQVTEGWRIPIFGKIPSLSALAPPPSFFKKVISSKFFITFLSVILLGFIFSVILSNLSYGQGIVGKIGILFSFAALFFGMFFFIYSLKYYITIAIVLSFSRRREGGDRGDWGDRGNKAAGLKSDLSHITLERHPFVSIHIATYNEKRVVERLLKAVTAMDYDNYEVVIVDDSNDETTLIIADYIKRNADQALIKRTEVDNKTLISAETKSGVVLKHLHRSSREGFKGGALKEALKHTDKRAEFVMVLDADFIPYPDTIVQFLKYFQATGGTLDLTNPNIEYRNSKQYQNTNDQSSKQFRASDFGFRASSRVAAVQGYQWHVLNKSENWITRGVRSEYAGSYVIERSGEEIYEGLKQISGSVYMIKREILEKIGWGTSLTEDFQLTLKLYELGYKVVYTPYIQAPAEAVSTIKRLIRQRMRWAEGHSHNIKKMFGRLLFGKWEDQSSVLGSQLSDSSQSVVGQPVGAETDQLITEQPISDNRQQKTDNRKIWKPSPLRLPEKLEFIYLSPYYLQAAFFILGTLSWFIAEVIFKVRLPFWTEIWGWSLVFTNLLALPLMNMVGLFMEESEERDYLGLFSFLVLSYIVAPFQGYAALKGFLAKEEGPWFRTPKTGRITDTFIQGRLYRWVRGFFGRPAVSLMSADQNADQHRSALSISANQRFNNFKIRRRAVRWVGNTSIATLLIVAIFLTNFANTLQFSTSAYAKQPVVKTVAGASQSNVAGTFDVPRDESRYSFGQKQTIVRNALSKEISGYRSIAKQTKNGETVEFIFHKTPKVRIKLGHREIEFETNRVGGKSVNPSNAKVYEDKEVIYADVIKDVDLKYTINGDLMTEEFIVKSREAAGVMIQPFFAKASVGTVEQTVRTVDVKVVSPGDPTAFGFFSEDGEELFKFGSPFVKDAKGENNVDVSIALEKPFDFSSTSLTAGAQGYRLTKTLGESAKAWLVDPKRAYPVSIDPSVIVSGGILEAETSYGGLQRKVVYMPGAVTPAWYAFASDANDASYYRSTDGSTWSAVQDLDTTDADNYNPSISVSGNIIIVFWIDDDGETVEGRRFDTTTAFPHTLGTLCTGNNQGTIGSTFMVTVAAISTTEVVVAFSDTSTDTEFNVFDVTGLDATCAAASFTTDLTPGNITFGSGITAEDRPVVVPVTGNIVDMIFQDGNLSYSRMDVSLDEWTRNNLTIASVTDTVYSVTTDGTTIWILTVSGTTATNFYSCCTDDFTTEVALDSDTGASGDDDDSDIKMYCVTSTDCKVVFTDDLDGTAPRLIFVDCNDETCSTSAITVLDSDVWVGASAATFGANPKIYCVSSTDCKVFYGDDLGGTSPDTTFIDCSNTDCSTQDTGSPADLQTDFGGAGNIPRLAIDCVGGSTDCKLLVKDQGVATPDLYFGDCGTSVCGSRTNTLLDGDVGGEDKIDLYCVSATNCKVVFHDSTDTNGNVDFIDCGAAGTPATCATPPAEDDIDTNVGTTAGAVPVAVDCVGGDLDCKVIYGDDTDDDLTFVDCSAADCSTTNSVTDIDLNGATNASNSTSVDMMCVSATDCKFLYVGDVTSGSEKLFFVDCDDAGCTTGSVIQLPGPRFQGALSCVDSAGALSSTNCKFAYYDVLSGSSLPVNFTDCDVTNCFPTATDAADPWTGQTAVETVSLTYDSTNSDLYAHIIMDTSDQAYWESTDATVISWGSQTSYAFTDGTLNQISAPEKGAGTDQIGVVLNQGSNYEFAPLPEYNLVLLAILPFMPGILRRLRRRNVE